MEIGKIEFGPNDSQLKYPGVVMLASSSFKRYDFTPQEDITSLEAVWVAHFFTWRSYTPEHPQWQIIKRHFTEVK